MTFRIGHPTTTALRSPRRLATDVVRANPDPQQHEPRQHEPWRDVRRIWRIGLAIATAVLYAWIGLSTHGLDGVLGLTGAVLIVGALIAADRSRTFAVTLLLLGAVPLAVITWRSLATPLLAVLAILFGWPRTHRPVSTPG